MDSKLLSPPESLLDRWLGRNNPARVTQAYADVYNLRPGSINELPPNAERVLAMPRALGAPYGATAQRQWAKRERIHARLRIARKGH